MTMEIHEIKKSKSRLHRIISFLFCAEFFLACLVVLAYVNYLAFSSDSFFEILLVAFADTSFVLLILDILTSD